MSTLASAISRRRASRDGHAVKRAFQSEDVPPQVTSVMPDTCDCHSVSINASKNAWERGTYPVAVGAAHNSGSGVNPTSIQHVAAHSIDAPSHSRSSAMADFIWFGGLDSTFVS